MVDTESLRLYQKRYRETHDFREYQKQYRKEHRESLLEYGRKYRKENRERLISYKHRPDIKRRDAEKQRTHRNREDIKEKIKLYKKSTDYKMRARNYYDKNRDKILSYSKEWFQRPETKDRLPKKRTAYKLRVEYGISVEEYEKMLCSQGGGCAICGSPAPGKRRLSVDHDHKTGIVRGILCVHCNTAAGMVKDDPEIARRLVEYLEKHRGSSNGEAGQTS